MTGWKWFWETECSANMQIDNNAMVIPVGDAFKRKLDEGRHASVARSFGCLKKTL